MIRLMAIMMLMIKRQTKIKARIMPAKAIKRMFQVLTRRRPRPRKRIRRKMTLIVIVTVTVTVTITVIMIMTFK